MKYIFISYKHKDEIATFDTMRALENLFGANSCWIDTAGIESGEYFRDIIRQ